MKNINKEELHILFEGIKKNDKFSFDTLYEKYKSLVYRIAFTVCKSSDISEEVVQNVFLKLWKLSKEKLPNSYEASWLYTVTKNETIDILRKNVNFVDLDSIYNIESDNNDIADIIDIDNYNRIINALKEDEKQILSLKLLYNFTFKEIGALLNIPAATAQWKYYKSIKFLKPAIANLAMFILTFALYLTSKKQSDNETSIQEHNITNSNDSSASLEGISDYITSSSYKEETIASNFSNNIYYPSLLCISSVFLVLTLIFAIFVKKSQQKLKNKTFKHYMKK